jgi:hypothetical protein
MGNAMANLYSGPMRCALILTTAFLAACGDSAPPRAIPEIKVVAISAASYGERWPLLVKDAKIGCEPPSIAFVEIGDRRCALNGKAIGAGMPRCDEASKSGNAVAFSVLIDSALALCLGRG